MSRNTQDIVIKSESNKLWGAVATVLLIALLISVLWPRHIDPETQVIYRDTVITEVRYDTIRDTIIRTKFINNVIHIPDTIVVPADVDTMDILKDYFAEVFVEDTLINDSTLFAYSEYVISKNRLQSREFIYENRIKTEVVNHITNVTNPLMNKLYLTAAMGGRPVTTYNAPSKFGLQLGLAFQDKKDHIYFANYDPLNKEFYFGTTLKIFQYGNLKRNRFRPDATYQIP